MREINNIILANIRNRKFWKFWKKLQLLCEIYTRLRRNIGLWDIRYLFDKKICRFIGIRRDIVSNIFSIRGITFFLYIKGTDDWEAITFLALPPYPKKWTSFDKSSTISNKLRSDNLLFPRGIHVRAIFFFPAKTNVLYPVERIEINWRCPGQACPNLFTDY